MSAEMPKMPEPFARISSVMGKVMLFDAPDFTMRKGDAVFTADQMREYAQEAARQAMKQLVHEYRKGFIDGQLDMRDRALLPQDPDHLSGVGNMVEAPAPVNGEGEKQ